MKFQQGEVTFRHSYGRNGEILCLQKEWLVFENIMYYVVRWSYVKLLMKLSVGVPVMILTH